MEFVRVARLRLESATDDEGEASLASFDLFVQREYGALRRYAYVLTGNRWDADDLVQAALVKTAFRWTGIRDPAAATAYVRQAMVRIQASRWRRANHERTLLAHARPVEASRDLADNVVERDAVWIALADLTPRQRAVVTLRFYDDLSEQAAAGVLGCAVGTVKSLTSRALARLRTSPAFAAMEDQ